MMSTKKYLCWAIVALMFLTVISAGCGGGGSETFVPNDNDTEQEQEKGNENPTPENPSNPNNPTEPTNPDNPAGPTEPDNPTDPTEPDNPTDPTEPEQTSVNGTWELTSGYVFASSDIPGGQAFAQGPCIPERMSSVNIEFLPEGADEVGAEYTLVLTGNNVYPDNENGDIFRVSFKNITGNFETEIDVHSGFLTHRTFTRTGENTYELDVTEENMSGVTGATVRIKSKLTLEGSYLHWTEYLSIELSGTSQDGIVETSTDIELKQAN